MMKKFLILSAPFLAARGVLCDTAAAVDSTVTNTGTVITTATATVLSGSAGPSVSIDYSDTALISSIVSRVSQLASDPMTAKTRLPGAGAVVSPIPALSGDTTYPVITATVSPLPAGSGCSSATVATPASGASKAASPASNAAANSVNPVAPAASGGANAAVAQAATSGCKSYTVKKDDTGYLIATANGITLPQLQAQNPGIVWEKIQPGQMLILPPAATGTGLGSAPDCKPPPVAGGIVPGAAAGGSSASAVAPSVAASGSVGSPAAGSTPPVSPTAKQGTSPANASTPPAASASPAASNVASPPATGTQSMGIGAEPVSALIHAGAVKDCSTADAKDECAPAPRAAPFVVDAFTQYKITTPGEQAAIISLMILESAGFKYNKNKVPGRPGQGTRNMMNAPFIKEYVESLKLTPTASEADNLALVLDDKYSFASAMWFYSAKCTDAVKAKVKEGSLAGYTAYIKECVQTELTADRTAGYNKAREALGVPIK